MSDPTQRQPPAGRGGEPRARADTPADPAPAPEPRGARTLDALVELVRRVTRADTAGVVGLSHDEGAAAWLAASGFRALAGAGRRGDFTTTKPGAGLVRHVAEARSLVVLEGVGASPEYTAEEFPLHAAEGVRTLALAPLSARGTTLGALVVGFRSAHEFSAEERETLEGLAGMAALALDNARLLETVITGKKIWEQTFDAIPDGIIVHDAAMIITRSNAAAAEMMGLDAPSEAVGLSCAAAFARLFGERAAAYHMTHRTGTATSFEIQAEDGRRYLVAVAPLSTSPESGVESAATEGDGRGPGAGDSSGAGQTDSEPADSEPRTSWSVITWSDVTQLSDMQEQLSRSRRLATVGQLAAGVAHEINNPLAAITTCAEATQRDLRSLPELAETARERDWNFYLEEIVRQALRCKAITRGLLDLSRQRRARREPCDVNAVIERTVKLFEERTAAAAAAAATNTAPPGGETARVRFSLSLDEAAGEVATDEGMLRQILDNLLTNAVDALGGPGQVEVSTASAGERVRLEVADTGPGIPPEMLVRIFEPFFTTKEAGRGSGLGLAIATSLAEALGGALTVESKPGAGSRFRLWLPRRAPEGRDEG